MNFFRHNWYKIGLFIGIITAITLPFYWSDINIVQRLLLLNFIAMTVHQFEEFGYPGGVPYLMNVEQCHSEYPDRYPQNANAVMIGNVATTYIFYLLPVFFPNQIWFGLGGVIIGLLQITAHVKLSMMLKSIYAPGNLAVFLGHIPIGIYFIYYGVTHNLISGLDWILAIGVFLFVGVVIVGLLGYKILADKNSPYPFTKEEMSRPWVINKMSKIKGQK